MGYHVVVIVRVKVTMLHELYIETKGLDRKINEQLESFAI